MSKHKYRSYGPQYTVSAKEGLTLEVLAAAEKAGSKAGYDTAKEHLYRSISTAAAMDEEQTQALLEAAQKAGAAAALSAARKVLDKTLRTSFRQGAPQSARHSFVPPPLKPESSDVQSDSTPKPYAETYEEPLARYSPPINIYEPPRHKSEQHVLTVTKVQRLSGDMVRITASAPGLDGYQTNGALDEYVKVFVADPALGLVPPYDVRELRRRLPREQLPRSKSYTIRKVDPVAEELSIDFVVHGEPGTVGHWAGQVQVGEALVISKARSKHSVALNAAYYVLAADEAGIPAVAKILEALPAEAKGVAVLEIAGEEAMFDVKHPLGVDLRWVFREGAPAGRSDVLSYALQNLSVPPHPIGVIAHAERSTIKTISRVVQGWTTDKHATHISSYWTLREGRLRSY